MDREQAVNELKARVGNDVIRHSLAVEAIMRELAALFKEDVEKWGLVGLLHDIDYYKTAGDPSVHGIVGADILENLGVDNSIIYAIKAHNDNSGIVRKRKMDKSIYAADPASKLILASTLLLPSRKLEDVTLEYILGRLGENDFEQSISRDKILTCSEMGLELKQFMEIALNSMKKISGDLDL